MNDSDDFWTKLFSGVKVVLLHSIIDVADRFWQEFDWKDRQWPVGYRYGWITMDYPEERRGSVIKEIARSNYDIPSYDYSIRVQGIPAGMEKDMINYIRLNNVHEKFVQEDVKSAGNSIFTASRIIHTNSKSYTEANVSASIEFEYNGKEYIATCVGHTFKTHDPMADDKPGYWGEISETYQVKEHGEARAHVQLPAIQWHGDKEEPSIRPKNLTEYFAKLASFSLLQTDPTTGQKQTFTLNSVRDGANPYVDDSQMTVKDLGNGYYEWTNLYAVVPKYNSSEKEYQYEFIDVCNIAAYNPYIISYRYSPLSATSTTKVIMNELRKKEEKQWKYAGELRLIDGRDLYIRDVHMAALNSFAEQGVTVQCYRQDGSLYETIVVTGNDIELRETEFGIKDVWVCVPVTDDHYQPIRHDFAFPDSLPRYSRAPLGVVTDKYYLMNDVTVNIHWEDGGNTTLRPDYLEWGHWLNGRDHTYRNSISVQKNRVEENLWTKTVSFPGYFDDDGSKFGVRIFPDEMYFPSVAGYSQNKLCTGNREEFKYVIDVTYKLEDASDVNIEGDIHWIDGPLGIVHSPATDADKVMINVLESGNAFTLQSGQKPVYNDEMTHYHYADRTDFPLWKDKVGGIMNHYSVKAQPFDRYKVSNLSDMDVVFTRYISVSGHVKWADDGTPDPHTVPQVTLMKDQEVVAGPVACTGNASDGFAYSFADLPISNNNETFYDYRIQVSMGESKCVIEVDEPVRNNEGDLTIDATLRAQTDVVSAKIPIKLIGEGDVPDAAKNDAFFFTISCTNDDILKNEQFILCANDTDDVKVIEIPELPDHNKTYTFEVRQTNIGRVPYWQYDETVGKVDISVRYMNNTAEPSYSISPAQAFGETEYLTFTNKFTVLVADVNARIVWNTANSHCAIPDSVDLILKAEGEAERQVAASAGNSWTAVFKDIPLFHESEGSMVPVFATLKAPDVECFDTNISGSTQYGYQVTYTQNTKIDIPVSAEWDFTHMNMDDVPDALSVTLKDITDSEEGETVTMLSLFKSNLWQGKFKNIDEFRQPVSPLETPVSRAFTLEVGAVDLFKIEIIEENGSFRIVMHEAEHAGIEDITLPEDNAMNAQIVGDLTPFLEKGEDRYEVQVRLVAKALTALNEAEDALLRKALGRDEKVLAMMDITAWKKVENRSVNNDWQQLHQMPGGEITVQVDMPMPYAKDSKMLFDVIRIHNGKAERISCTQDHAQKTITFRSDKFSTYVITGRKIPDLPQTGDDSNLPLMLGVLALSLTGLAMLCRKHKVF